MYVVHDDVVTHVLVGEDIVDLWDARSGAVEHSKGREIKIRSFSLLVLFLGPPAFRSRRK